MEKNIDDRFYLIRKETIAAGLGSQNTRVACYALVDSIDEFPNQIINGFGQSPAEQLESALVASTALIQQLTRKSLFDL